MQHKSYNLKNGQVLDLGAGTGWRSILYAKEGNTVVAVDMNKKRITALEEKAKAEGVENNIATTLADIREFPIVDGYFDVILLNNVLPFISDKKEVAKILNKAWRGLKKGGYLEFTLFGMRDAWNGTEPNMSFWDGSVDFPILFKEHTQYVYWKAEEEGMAPMQNGELKYWHVYLFTLKK